MDRPPFLVAVQAELHCCLLNSGETGSSLRVQSVYALHIVVAILLRLI